MKSIATFIAIFLFLNCYLYGQTSHQVSISGRTFVPATLTINIGDTVEWVNNSGGFHTTTSGSNCNDDGVWDANLPNGGSYSFVFNQSGNFPYFCRPHCSMGMTGEIIVQGCTIIAGATVDQNETCAGDCNGQATASGSGGVSPYTYFWSDGQTTQTATNFCAGSYMVTVTDANGCTGSASVVIQAGASVTASATVDQHETCAGDCDGQATASGSGGTSPYTFMWNNGQMTQSVSNLCAGSYSVTVTDANGCSDIATVVINPGGTVTATADVVQHETCAGACDGVAIAIGSGGLVPYSFQWSNGSTNSSISGLCPGSYTVTVSDANGCSDVDGVTINIGGTVIASASVDQHESCTGSCDGQATASGSGGTVPYSYSWSTGATGATVSGLCPGTYGVTVTDALGCIDFASVTINAGVSVVASVVVDQHESCDGACDGQATASGSGGTAPYSYSWSSGATGATVSGLCSGTYEVIVTDASGCLDIASVIINGGQPPVDPAFSFDTKYCESDDPITLPTTSDNGITGNWSGPGVNNNTLDPDLAGVGNWDITFTPDQAQCAILAIVTMTVNDCGCENPASADAGLDQAVCAITGITIQLNGTITGAGSATWTSSGTGTFNDPGSLMAIYTPSEVDIDNGSVTLTLTTEDPDGNGPCSAASDQVLITLNFQPEIGKYNDVEVCNEYILPDFKGAVSSNAGYYDSPGRNGNEYAPGDVIAESQTIYVYDSTAAGCIDEVSYDVIISEVSVDVGPDKDICVSENEIDVAASLSGVNNGSWTTSGTGTFLNSSNISTVYMPSQADITAGSVSITFTTIDPTGPCEAINDVLLITFVNITAIAGNDQSIAYNTSTTLSASANEGSGYYSYRWTPADKVVNPTSASTETVNLTATTDFTVLVMDDTTGCMDEDVVRVTVTGGPLSVHIDGERNAICIGESTTIEAVVSGGVGSYTYNWTSDPEGFISSEASVVVSPTVTTIYMVEISDENGNMVSDTFKVEVHPLPVADAGPDTSYCADEESINICASMITNGTYSWKNGSSTLSGRCAELTTGKWILTVENENGCTNTDTVIITQSEPIVVTLSPDSTVIITGGTAPYDTSFTVSGDSLSVVVTDVKGCTGRDIIVITSSTSTLLAGISVFPNPARNLLLIETGNVINYQVILYNQQGEELLNKNNIKRIGLEDYVPGVYYLQISINRSGVPRVKRIPLVIMR